MAFSLLQSDINWAELDGRLRRLSASGELKGGSVEDELEVRTLQARELRRLAGELRNRLRRSEELRAAAGRQGGKAVAEVQAVMGAAVDDFKALESTVDELEAQVRHHATELASKETTILEQSAETDALRAKLGRQEKELARLRAELAVSKQQHLADIRTAQQTCDLQRTKLASEVGQTTRLRAELAEVRAKVERLEAALSAQQTLTEQAAQEAAGLRADATAAQQMRRLYEDAKYEADRFRREAARLAKLLGQVRCHTSPTSLASAPWHYIHKQIILPSMLMPLEAMSSQICFKTHAGVGARECQQR